MLLKNALSFFGQWVLQTSDTVRFFNIYQQSANGVHNHISFWGKITAICLLLGTCKNHGCLPVLDFRLLINVTFDK